MDVFLKEFGVEIQKILDGNLTFYHYLFLAVGVAGWPFVFFNSKKGFLRVCSP